VSNCSRSSSNARFNRDRIVAAGTPIALAASLGASPSK
jgi:hypothetical protein